MQAVPPETLCQACNQPVNTGRQHRRNRLYPKRRIHEACYQVVMADLKRYEFHEPSRE